MWWGKGGGVGVHKWLPRGGGGLPAGLAPAMVWAAAWLGPTLPTVDHLASWGGWELGTQSFPCQPRQVPKSCTPDRRLPEEPGSFPPVSSCGITRWWSCGPALTPCPHLHSQRPVGLLGVSHTPVTHPTSTPCLHCTVPGCSQWGPRSPPVPCRRGGGGAADAWRIRGGGGVAGRNQVCTNYIAMKSVPILKNA